MTLSTNKKAKITAKPLKNLKVPPKKNWLDKAQVSFRSSDEFAALVSGLAGRLDLSDADLLRLGVFRIQKHLDRLLEKPTSSDLELMHRPVPEATKFRLLLERRPPEDTERGLDLIKILRDFHSIGRLEDDELRVKALDALEQKLHGLFDRARKQIALNRKEKKEAPLSTELDLI